jgi:hypothetical protein
MTEEAVERKQETLILVGFGKHDLKEVLSWRGTPREEDAILAPTKWPPRYRRESICDPEDVERFMEYVGWVQGLNYRDYVAF